VAEEQRVAEFKRYTVRLAQIAPVLGDVQANLERHLELIAAAQRDGVRAIIFPELSLTGYYLRDLVPDVALPLTSPVLAKLAEASRDISVSAGFVEQTPRFSFHVAQGFFEGGRLVHVHEKTYLPTYGMFDEERYLSRGNRIEAFDCSLGRLALMMCEELWHPSAVYLAALQGISLMIGVASSPGRGLSDEGLAVQATYERMLPLYAELFQVNCIFVNRVGYEDGVNFWGGSQAYAAGGRLLARAPTFEEAIVDVEIDEGAVRRARVSTPLLSDERPHFTLRELRRILNERA